MTLGAWRGDELDREAALGVNFAERQYMDELGYGQGFRDIGEFYGESRPPVDRREVDWREDDAA